MRIVYLGNNKVGLDILRLLKDRNENVVAVVLHPESRSKFRSEIAQLSADALIVPADTLHDPAVLQQIAALQPDIGISAFFGYILRSDFLSLFPKGCVNIHPALLPYNRGAHSNVWSIIDGTPAGVTIHYIDAGVDTGDVIMQAEVPVYPTDTGETLYRRLEHACSGMFAKAWPLIRAGNAPRTQQPSTHGTSHRTKDLQSLDRIDLDKSYTARELINILRARTFPPYHGAYFETDGKKIHVRVELTEAPAKQEDDD